MHHHRSSSLRIHHRRSASTKSHRSRKSLDYDDSRDEEPLENLRLTPVDLPRDMSMLSADFDRLFEIARERGDDISRGSGDIPVMKRHWSDKASSKREYFRKKRGHQNESFGSCESDNVHVTRLLATSHDYENPSQMHYKQKGEHTKSHHSIYSQGSTDSKGRHQHCRSIPDSKHHPNLVMSPLQGNGNDLQDVIPCEEMARNYPETFPSMDNIDQPSNVQSNKMASTQRWLETQTDDFAPLPDMDIDLTTDMRPRLYSNPIHKTLSIDSGCSNQSDSSMTSHSFRRVRSFRITRRGLQKEDLVVKSSKETLKQEILGHRPLSDYPKQRIHQVLVLGSHGVGKKALIKDFLMPDEYLEKMGFVDRSDEDGEKSVSILLDGEESTLEFVDLSDHEVDQFITAEQIDAYVVVYSVEDRKSFETAIDRLFEIRQEDGREVALILVANKTDLVRTRVVHEDEGKSAAKTYDCKYIEVSAAIDHKIDELLVGILKQIRLMKEQKKMKQKQLSVDGKDSCCPLRAKHHVLDKLFGRPKRAAKSCENLYVL